MKDIYKDTTVTQKFACFNLVGKVIDNWMVVESLPKPTSVKKTGGTFSLCYHVERAGIKYFMKVLDYIYVMKSPLLCSENRSIRMQRCTSEFNYEKKLSKYCNDKRIDKVVTYVDSGEIEMEGYEYGTVSYIIYEIAKGDIKDYLNFTVRLTELAHMEELSKRLKSLHDVSVGLSQLHNNKISHQDIKPSNIMAFEEETKIGDLGRSLILSSEIKCPYDLWFNGDFNYAPIEAFYNVHLESDEASLFQIDNYMLGGLIAFYISGQSYNAILNRHMPYSMPTLRKMGYSYAQVKDFVVSAHPSVIQEIKDCIAFDSIRDELSKLVDCLCTPEANKRGDPKTVAASGNNYSLERIITRLDVLHKKAEIELNKQ